MSIHLGDSVVYGHLWSTEEARSLLGEEARFRAWLDILATLAEAQAEVGLIPAEAAGCIRDYATEGEIDLDRIAAETRATGHSTLGLIRVLRATSSLLPPASGSTTERRSRTSPTPGPRR